MAFTARRHGYGPDWFDAVATAAAAALTLTAAAGVLELQTTTPRGPFVSLLAGLGAVGAGSAAVASLDREAIRARERRILGAFIVSALALVFGSLLTSVAAAFVPAVPVVRVPVTTAVASLGFATVGVAFIASFDGSIDVSTPNRHDVLVAGVGIVAIFSLHVLLNVAVTWLSLPQTEHSLIETARANPEILPPLIVVSLLFVAPGEELLARNGLQKFLYGAYSRRSAIVAASFVFAASHILAYSGTGAAPGAVLVTLTRVFVVALVLGATYERTDDLFAPTVVHGVYNAVQFAMAYFAFT